LFFITGVCVGTIKLIRNAREWEDAGEDSLRISFYMQTSEDGGELELPSVYYTRHLALVFYHYIFFLYRFLKLHLSSRPQVLDQMLPLLFSRGHRVVLFSQSTQMLNLLEDVSVFSWHIYYIGNVLALSDGIVVGLQG
jgi:SNF2 family DNA or RNA helicase